MVLTYAEIPFTPIYDEEVLSDQLILYDWLHLHHEDFTGQYGKFYGAYRNAPWYIDQKKDAEALAAKLGYAKVSEEKLAVAKKIRYFVIGGGFMFAMCSATDSFDIALSAEGVDICEPMFDGNESTPNYQNLIDYSKTFDDACATVPRIRPMVTDVSSALYAAHKAGANLLFEGAQGSLLDVDHGTYPFVTSSNCVAGNAAAGSGVGPNMLHYVLGITKAYTTRVGSGPFPSELSTDDGVGKHLSAVGHEFGTVTGRARRCGWFDAALLKRSVQINGVSGMCLTKLDVLDGLDSLKLCTGYKLHGKQVDIFPVGAEDAAACEPIYEEMPGWKDATVGAKSMDALPAAARAYVKRIEELVGVPVDMVSTGPDREETIVLRHPFE
jgi:adenylosuccinate synthase